MHQTRLQPQHGVFRPGVVSRANAKQRKGCAGGVMTGVGVQLFTSNHNLLDQHIPEIHRVPLDQLVLKIKILPLFQDMSIHEVLGTQKRSYGEKGILSHQQKKGSV
ncbi:unnamed protein product [Arctia plantaginis]|uniref:Uncharacterized protein n=1 Tax=Arctia plantaginis TaxID=874455 RepID=A0A8S1B9N3_ARCPL|nr:unnamed protein product [Arctia plantaginis]